MDIVQYTHKKEFQLEIIELGPDLSAIRDRWAYLMKNYLGPCNGVGLIYERDPTLLSPYLCQLANAKIRTLPGGGAANGKYWPIVKVLGQMARAMEYLLVQSLTAFESNLRDIEENGLKSLTNSPDFRSLLSDTRQLKNRHGYNGHPKMEKLREMCIRHFEKAEGELDENGKPRETRVMVFCNFRAVVEEIVDCLNQQRPLIKATPFVGQSAAKGVKGKTQKDQIEVSFLFE